MTERPPRDAAPAVHFNIDRVDVIGLPMSSTQSRQLRAAFTFHLQELIRESPWATSATAAMVPDALAPVINVSKASTPASIGRDVAGALFAALRSTR